MVFNFVGGEFMPALEEGNLWIRADMQPDISFQASAKLADEIRATLRAYPEITQVVSQMGRPDDGTDVSTFNNIEFLADLKPRSQWRPQFHSNKDRVDRRDSAQLSAVPRRRFQLFAKYPGQCGGSDVRRQGGEFAQAFRQRFRRTNRACRSHRGHHEGGSWHHRHRASSMSQVNRAC